MIIEPASAVVCASDSATFSAKRGKAAPEVTWTIEPSDRAGVLKPWDQTPVVNYTAPSASFGKDRNNGFASTGIVTLTATWIGKDTKDEKKTITETATAQINLGGLCQTRYGGELARATLGFEQVGAAGTTNTQKYSLDFFISRPLPIGSAKPPAPVGAAQVKQVNEYVPPVTDAEYYFGPRARWWGDVRIGSYPQQVNSDVAKFVKDFTTNAGALKVNTLVQTAEFMTGLEVRVGQFSGAREAAAESSKQRFALMTFVGIGAIGPFPPADDPAVFAVPSDTQSPQYAAFHAAYPSITSRYVAFVPEAHRQFSHQWGAGFRLYTFYADQTPTSRPLSKAPASVEISLGRNDLVAPSGMVWHASAYYPFPLGDRTKADTLVIYLFGDASMRAQQTPSIAPMYLGPGVDDKNAAIPLTNKDVSIVVAPNRRDTYRVGVSIDLIRVWNKLSAPPVASTGK